MTPMADSWCRAVSAVEFAAHNGDVRCVRIGRKTSGVLATGGDDKKVNVWAIGRTTATLVGRARRAMCLFGFVLSAHMLAPHAPGTRRGGTSRGGIATLPHAQRETQSLQGHTAPVESVTFDRNEEVVAAGAANGSIKTFELQTGKGKLLALGAGGRSGFGLPQSIPLQRVTCRGRAMCHPPTHACGCMPARMQYINRIVS